jgi:hypothetical protein
MSKIEPIYNVELVLQHAKELYELGNKRRADNIFAIYEDLIKNNVLVYESDVLMVLYDKYVPSEGSAATVALHSDDNDGVLRLASLTSSTGGQE